MGPLSLLGSRLDSGACCHPDAHERRPRLLFKSARVLRGTSTSILVSTCVRVLTYSSFSTSSEGSEADWSASGSDKSRTI